MYCDDDGEYRIYFHVCDRLAIDRCSNNYLKSQTHVFIFRKKQQLRRKNNSTLHS